MNKFIMLVGLPGSGKSTLARMLKDLYNAEICSSDCIRKELYGDESVQGDNNKVFAIMHKRVKNALNENKSVIYDATNLSSKKRIAFLKSIKKYNVEKICYIVATPYEICCKNNQNRERVVPDNAMDRMYKSWQTPSLNEGFDEIEIHYYDMKFASFLGSWRNAFDEYIGYAQNNPYHLESLNEHVGSAYLYTKTKTSDENCRIASYLHDIGKPFCKFDKCGISHYYGHENVGAYNAFFYSDIPNKLKVSLLVNYHMVLHNFGRMDEDELMHKYKNLLGSELYKHLEIIHESDKYGATPHK